MEKWNLIVDVAKCNNCANCTLAAMDEHIGNDFPGYAAPQPQNGRPWIEIRRVVRGEGTHVDVSYMPTMCNHCDKPSCTDGAGGAVVKRNDGIVLIDPVKAKGRRDLVEKCPYGAIHWNEERHLPQIWIFDAHLLDAGWQTPRCQQACPTGAYRALKISDRAMQALAYEEGLETRHPEFDTSPRVYYKGLHRMQRRFIAGSVITTVGGVPDCQPECRVTLVCNGTAVANTETDWFGDFKIDGLPDDRVDYELMFEHPDHESLCLPVSADAPGKDVGVVSLQPRRPS